ncbi:hypothetical protein Q8F55_007652 [Vanrija albida]|uniref:Uncharacterized protein n=1 Tax=Vanrija albida TaxID=181172 RepID=A0ABR3PU51_9TREE
MPPAPLATATASPMPPPAAPTPWSERRAALRPVSDSPHPAASPVTSRAGAPGRSSRADATVTASTAASPMPPPLVPASPRRTPAHTHSYSIAAPGAAAAAAGTPNRRPVTPSRHKVSRSLGAFPVTPDGRFDSPASPSPSRAPVRPVLPVSFDCDAADNKAHPADWSPSELAQYLAYSLRTGGSDGTGPTLPPLVVEDVVSWVLRSRVTGKQFTSSSQGFSGSRPPPFFPVLQSLSRRLARNVRHGRRLSDASEASSAADRQNDSDGVADVTRVRRLAHAFEAASEVGSDDAPSLSALRAQVTGNSVEGFGRATPKYGSNGASWKRTRRDSEISSVSEAPSHPAPTGPRWRQRRDSNASVVSAISGVSAISASANVPRWRQEVAVGSPPRSVSNPTVSPPRSVSNPLHNSPARSPHSATGSPSSSPKGALCNLSPISPLQPISERPATSQAVPVVATSPDDPFTDRQVGVVGITGASPPPPYENAFPPSLLVPEPPRTPEGTAASRSASATPLRPEVHVSPHFSPHARHRDAYAGLRRAPGRPRAYSDETEESNTSDDEGSEAKAPRAGDHWSTTRVVTLRPKTPKTASATLAPPSPALKTPAPLSVHTTPGSRRRRKGEMEREVTSLTDRIKELEARLSAMETPPVLSPALSPGSVAGANAVSNDSGAPEGVPDDGPRDEGPRDLPIYVFLVGLGVGVGVSAVVARVLLAQRAA